MKGGGADSRDRHEGAIANHDVRGVKYGGKGSRREFTGIDSEVGGGPEVHELILMAFMACASWFESYEGAAAGAP